MQKIQLTQWQQHQARWGKGCGHSACQTAGRVVLARGHLPADVLFIGEAPGPSENVLGVPFVGPAGQLLDRVIQRARAPLDVSLRLAFTNMCGCIPLDEHGEKFTEPPDEQVACCGRRLADLVRITAPKLLVCVGKTARDWLDPEYKHAVRLPMPLSWEGKLFRWDVAKGKHEQARIGEHVAGAVLTVFITHPAAILRTPIAARSMAVQRATVQLRNAFELVVQHPKEQH